MEKIELEFDSKLTSTEQVLEKVSQVVKYAREQGLNLRELELESEAGEKENNEDLD
jgi:isopropylmalate/homocitrate/citramalate synthase